jgi:hypothetical protein
VRPGGHQRDAGAIPGVVALEAFFYPEAEKIGWPDLENRTVRFGGHCELVLASVMISAFGSGTLLCSAATSTRVLSALGFASPLAEDSLPGYVFS